MRIRLLASWGALVVVGFVVLGCDDFFTNGSTTPGTTGFVYVLNSAQGAGGVGSISGYQANASTGVLSQLVNSPFGTGLSVPPPSPTSCAFQNCMSADALGEFVYVSTSAGVVGFAISRNTSTFGQLACVQNCTPTPTNAPPLAIAEDPSARAVYVAEAGPQVEGFSINTSTGVLTAQKNSPYSLVPPETSGVSPTSATVGPSGGFLFVGMNNGDVVSVPINSDGTLNTAAASNAAPGGSVKNVAALVANPQVTFGYAVDGNQFLSVYTINRSTGAFTAVNQYSVQSASPVGVAVSALNGASFVFTANRGSNNVSSFIVQSNGSLTFLNTPIPVSATTPVAMAVDPSEAFLYLVGQASNSVLSFVIVNGQLNLPSTSNPPTGQAPIAVVAVPGGR